MTEWLKNMLSASDNVSSTRVASFIMLPVLMYVTVYLAHNFTELNYVHITFMIVLGIFVFIPKLLSKVVELILQIKLKATTSDK